MYDKVSKRNNHNFLFDMSFLKCCVNNNSTMSDFHFHSSFPGTNTKNPTKLIRSTVKHDIMYSINHQ